MTILILILIRDQFGTRNPLATGSAATYKEARAEAKRLLRRYMRRGDSTVWSHSRFVDEEPDLLWIVKANGESFIYAQIYYK